MHKCHLAGVEWSEAGREAGRLERERLERAVETLNGAIFFLVVIIGSVLLSWLSLLEQRRQARATLEGEDLSDAPSVFPQRLGASALVIGALGFFFCLALERERTAQSGEDPVERRSAGVNGLASALVLGAALLRLDDLLFVERSGQRELQETDDQPPV